MIIYTLIWSITFLTLFLTKKNLYIKLLGLLGCSISVLVFINHILFLSGVKEFPLVLIIGFLIIGVMVIGSLLRLKFQYPNKFELVDFNE